MKTCVFAGTFDPITKGHEYCINKCLTMFDKVVIAIGVNVDKNPLFSLSDRKKMIELAFNGDDRIVVKTFDNMLVDFMKDNGIFINVRGIRDQDDYKYETTMSRYNLDMYKDLTTIFLPTPQDLVYVSSTAIRNILSLNGDISKYVSKPVYDYVNNLKNK